MGKYSFELGMAYWKNRGIMKEAWAWEVKTMNLLNYKGRTDAGNKWLQMISKTELHIQAREAV